MGVRWRTAVVLVPLVATFLFPLGICAAEDSPSPSAQPDARIMRIGIPSDADDFNPFAATMTLSNECLRTSYDFLTTWDADGQVVPDLAEEWSYSDDGKTWTFKIRSGVTWHDGEPLTAGDVAFTYNYIVENDLSTFKSLIPAVIKAEAIDDSTVVIECSEMTNSLLNGIVPILPEHVWSTIPEDEILTYPNLPVIGTGPFQVVEYKKGSHVKLVANDSYFRGAPKLDEIHWLVYQTVDGMVQDYQSGVLDAVVDLSPNHYLALKDAPGSMGYAGKAITFHQLGMNCWEAEKSEGNKLLLDTAVRQAVHYAIDKETLVERVLRGLGEAGTSIIPPAAPYHWEPPADQLVTYDPAMAQQILEDAGYVDRDGDGIRESADGKPLSFKLTAMTEYPECVQAAKLIHDWLADVGIEGKVTTETESAFIDRLYGDADYDLYLWMWNGRPDPSFLLQAFLTAQIQNWSDCQYSNPEYDRLFDEQLQAVTLEEREPLVFRMQEITYEDAPYAVLWYMAKLEVVRNDRFVGWQLVPADGGVPLLSRNKLNYLTIAPVGAEEPATETGSLVWVLLIVLVAAVVVVIGVIAYTRRHRRIEE